jgi:hypothetical protein
MRLRFQPHFIPAYVIRLVMYGHVTEFRPGKKGGQVEFAVVWTVCPLHCQRLSTKYLLWLDAHFSRGHSALDRHVMAGSGSGLERVCGCADCLAVGARVCS